MILSHVKNVNKVISDDPRKDFLGLFYLFLTVLCHLLSFRPKHAKIQNFSSSPKKTVSEKDEKNPVQ